MAKKPGKVIDQYPGWVLRLPSGERFLVVQKRKVALASVKGDGDNVLGLSAHKVHVTLRARR